MKNEDSEKKITKDVVEYVAGLSRLSFRDEQLKKFGEQLSGILAYIEQLNELNTDDVPPTTHVLPSMKNVFREDEEKPSLDGEKALSNAPESKENFFKVPRIIKEA